MITRVDRFGACYAAEQLLETADRGMDLLTNAEIGDWNSGLQIICAFGRSVTIALQRLRNIEPVFDEWYEPYRAEMQGDELLVYFKDLRNTILKTGEMPPMASYSWSEFNQETEQLEPRWVANSVHGAPTTHLGRPIEDSSIQTLCWHYLEYLRRLTSAARETFGQIRPGQGSVDAAG